MKVLICGAGQVGFSIARQLASEDNDVTVIDESPEKAHKIGDTLDAKAFVGFASHPDVLDQAGATDSDMIIAVTFADEVNMVACQVAHSVFNVPTKIARVRSGSYLNPKWRDIFSRNHMPIDVIISPEIEVARAVVRRLEVPGAIDMMPFADGRVRVIGVRCNDDCPVVNTPLRQLTELFPDLTIMVLAILRGDRMLVPRANDQMFVGDEVYFAVDADHITRAMAAFGHEERKARRVIVVGGGNIGFYLAREMEENYAGVSLKVIENDRDRALKIADRFSRTVVIHGDAVDNEILNEANVQAAETIISVTNDDEINILSSLLAKRSGTARAFTLIKNLTYTPLVSSLGIDVVVNPRDITVSTILQHVRRGRIRAARSLHHGDAELIEAEALETAPLVGKPLREIRFPAGILIGAMVRDDNVIIPCGDTVIRAKDRVIAIAASGKAKSVERMFSAGLEFF